jgi:hypothetical protein
MKSMKAALTVVLLAALVVMLARTSRVHHAHNAVATVLPTASEPAAVSRFAAPPPVSIDEEISHIRDIADPEERSGIIEQLSNSRMETLLDALTHSTNAADMELRDVLVRQWAVRNVRAAAQWADQLAGSARNDAISQISIAWAEQDVAAAIDWARTLPPDNGRSTALLQIGYEAARNDPILSIRLSAELRVGPERDELMLHAVRQWAASDSAAAFQWASQINDAAISQKARAAIMTAWAEQDGYAAATQAAGELSPGPLQDQTVVSIIQRWSQNEPETAAAWVQEFPPSPLGFDAMENLITSWSEFDAPAAQRWIQTLPPSPLRDAGLNQLHRGTRPIDDAQPQ